MHRNECDVKGKACDVTGHAEADCSATSTVVSMTGVRRLTSRDLIASSSSTSLSRKRSGWSVYFMRISMLCVLCMCAMLWAMLSMSVCNMRAHVSMSPCSAGMGDFGA